ncbi:hypothetical protein FISHEDRAFT_60148 [Fistulina hepatica ATCC 64428]|uniref:Uncharacterized protein n=1 Tax=Fistulina hepatica ATCC 64428 TaxID=1128425 RepID=A0A0D7A6V0_9AGAR|nr:hypothetical protein FISHEDRAFT_60148 [Fistulina hepatica ATCC 64428]
MTESARLGKAVEINWVPRTCTANAFLYPTGLCGAPERIMYGRWVQVGLRQPHQTLPPDQRPNATPPDSITTARDAGGEARRDTEMILMRFLDSRAKCTAKYGKMIRACDGGVSQRPVWMLVYEKRMDMYGWPDRWSLTRSARVLSRQDIITFMEAEYITWRSWTLWSCGQPERRSMTEEVGIIRGPTRANECGNALLRIARAGGVPPRGGASANPGEAGEKEAVMI